METHIPKNIPWKKITVPIVAVLLVLAIVIYTGGFGNFLKFLGIRASQLETIQLTTTAQLEGSGSESWLVSGSTPVVNGAGAFASSEAVPADPGEQGFIMSLYSSEDPIENTYTEHTYISAVIDLGTESPILSSYEVQVFVPEGASQAHSYRTASTVEGLQSASFAPVELALIEGEDVTTAVAPLEVGASRYLQVKVGINDTFTSRSAVYGWTLQYDPNVVVEEEPIPDTIVQPPLDPGSDDEPDIPVPASSKTLTIDFTEADELPDTISIQVLSTSLGVQPVIEESGVDTDEAAPLYVLEKKLANGGYVLVVRSAGYETMVIPFEISGNASMKVVKLLSFEAQPQGRITFDLNGDGVVNSLDVATLLSQINKNAS